MGSLYIASDRFKIVIDVGNDVGFSVGSSERYKYRILIVVTILWWFYCGVILVEVKISSTRGISTNIITRIF